MQAVNESEHLTAGRPAGAGTGRGRPIGIVQALHSIARVIVLPGQYDGDRVVPSTEQLGQQRIHCTDGGSGGEPAAARWQAETQSPEPESRCADNRKCQSQRSLKTEPKRGVAELPREHPGR